MYIQGGKTSCLKITKRKMHVHIIPETTIIYSPHSNHVVKKIGIFGSSGTGKTTLGIKILKKLDKKVYYILDDNQFSQKFDLEAFDRARIDYKVVKTPPKECDCVVYASHPRFDLKKLLRGNYYMVIVEHVFPIPEIMDSLDVIYITAPLFCCLKEYREHFNLTEEDLLYLANSPIGAYLVKTKSL